MVASVDRSDMAVATGSKSLDPCSRGYDRANLLPVTYLFRTVGQVLGVSLSGTIVQGVLVRELRARITGPNSEEASPVVNLNKRLRHF
jgi:hypothetical protein